MMLVLRYLHPGVSVTYRITDFYPETAFAANKGRFLRFLVPFVRTLRNSADRIEALSNCQFRRLVEDGVRAQRIQVVRDQSPIAIGRSRPAARPFSSDDFVLLYSGNLGVAHDWVTFAEAYKLHVLEGPNRIRLWLNATGTGVAGLLDFCMRNNLPVHASGPVALEDLPSVLVAADAHLILLGRPFWGYVFPSKVYGCLESGRPCLYVGPAESDVHDMMLADPRNCSARPGDINAVVEALDLLSVPTSRH